MAFSSPKLNMGVVPSNQNTMPSSPPNLDRRVVPSLHLVMKPNRGDFNTGRNNAFSNHDSFPLLHDDQKRFPSTILLPNLDSSNIRNIDNTAHPFNTHPFPAHIFLPDLQSPQTDKFMLQPRPRHVRSD